jgi:hypothetical protein
MVLPVVVALNVVNEYVVEKFVAGNVRLPDTVKPIPVPASVIAPSRPDAVKSLHTLGEFAIVTVNAVANTFEFASKNTLSDAVGTDAPPTPPDDADQLVVLVESQVPVPRTQYLSAITLPQIEVQLLWQPSYQTSAVAWH